MLRLNLLRRSFNPFLRMKKVKVLNDLCTYKEFRVILERERSRADRDGTGFSLVTFDIEKGETKESCFEYLMQRLQVRPLRSTDYVGWFDKHLIGVFLHNTHTEGAWSFASDICETFVDNTLTSRCTVYSYPNDWTNIDNETRMHNGSSPWIKSPKKDNTIPDNQALFIKQTLSGSAELAFKPVPSSAKNCVRPVLKFQSFLVHRVPVWKRILDIVGATLGLVIFSPIMLAVAIGIKLESKGPIIHTQKRSGLGGKHFTFYKFRSMFFGAEHKKKELMKYNYRRGPVFKMKDDPRITRVGSFIRKWSIDELPQFFNVLRGDMSMIGPRPPTIDEVPQYDRWHNRRLDIKPGITCLWQAYARQNKCFDNWVRMDIEYAKKCSLLLDMKILLKTISAVLSCKGAF